jgi:predicted DNA-binding transcriptional regulator AlpA
MKNSSYLSKSLQSKGIDFENVDNSAQIIQKSPESKELAFTECLLRPRAASRYLSMSESGLWQLLKRGDLISYKLSPKVTVLRKSELDEYVQRCMKTA